MAQTGSENEAEWPIFSKRTLVTRTSTPDAPWTISTAILFCSRKVAIKRDTPEKDRHRVLVVMRRGHARQYYFGF